MKGESALLTAMYTIDPSTVRVQLLHLETEPVPVTHQCCSDRLTAYPYIDIE